LTLPLLTGCRIVLVGTFDDRKDKNMTEKTTTTETSIDPICGMQVEPATATGSFSKDGETYYFCSSGCLQKFIDPTAKKKSSCCNGG